MLCRLRGPTAAEVLCSGQIEVFHHIQNPTHAVPHHRPCRDIRYCHILCTTQSVPRPAATQTMPSFRVTNMAYPENPKLGLANTTAEALHPALEPLRPSVHLTLCTGLPRKHSRPSSTRRVPHLHRLHGRGGCVHAASLKLCSSNDLIMWTRPDTGPRRETLVVQGCIFYSFYQYTSSPLLGLGGGDGERGLLSRLQSSC